MQKAQNTVFSSEFKIAVLLYKSRNKNVKITAADIVLLVAV